MKTNISFKEGACLGFYDETRKECKSCEFHKPCKQADKKNINKQIRAIFKTTEEDINKCIKIIEDA